MYELVSFVGPGASAIIAAAESFLIQEVLPGVWSEAEAVVCNREQEGGGGRSGSPLQSLYVCAAC